jgi:hypothetical protein
MTRRRRRITSDDPPHRRSGAVHVRGIRNGERWIVVGEDDVTPISEHRTRADAETAARAHAQTFGYEHIIVHELDGDELLLRVPDPDPQPPYPGGAKGAPAG